MTNQRHATLYVGVTSELKWRVTEHKEKRYPKIIYRKYNLDKLVYYEMFDDIESAIAREKQLNSGSRKKNPDLVNFVNPKWKDLFEEVQDW